MSDRQRDEKLNEALSVLMAQTQAGDEVAYRELLNKLGVLAQSFVRRHQRRTDDAEREDVVQEILLAIHNKRHTYDPSQLFLPWFYSIARYKVIDRFRARKREPALDQAMSDVDLENLEAANFTDTLSELSVTAQSDLESLLKELPAKQRDSLKLIKLSGLSYAEAAEKLSITEADVKVSVHRAIKNLRKRFQL